jgi:uncharacterized protein YydD (DUF2326 family)
MKIVQIYTNNKPFKNVTFNEGFNVVIGKVTKREEFDKDTHNLGKSTLVSVIDFLLLKDIDKEHIFLKHYDKFKDYVFYMEVRLNNGKYLTLKRSIKEHTKVSIKLHKEKFQNFIDLIKWDYENLSMSSKKESDNPKSILNQLLDFDVLKDYSYRKTVNYFLRTQSDYDEVFHLSKFKGKHSDWKPLLLEILGFKSETIIQKYQLEEEYQRQENFLEQSKNKFSINTEEIDKIRGLIQIKEQERSELQNLIDEFNFYTEEKNINSKIIEEIETKISELNSIEYNLKYEIEKIKDSLESQVTFDIDSVEQIFKEVNIYFPNQLRKSYDSLIEFNKKVTEERNKYLHERLSEVEKSVKSTEGELLELNNDRVKLLSFLKEKDSFKKFKNYQMGAVCLDNELIELKNKLEQIDFVKGLRQELTTIRRKAEELTQDIEKQIKDSNELYKNIRLSFSQFIKKVINQPAVLSIPINSKGNVEFKAEITGSDGAEVTSKGKGFSYTKIRCACFDLALLVNYTNKSFFRFVYHDGILEGLDNRKKINFLKLTRQLCDDYGIQYILTLIEDDSPRAIKDEEILFKKEEIAVVLDDRDDDKGKLFEMSF